MLALTTERHKMFITITGLRGDCRSDFGGLGRELDAAVDRLLSLCQGDKSVREGLILAQSRSDAYQVIARHLKAATPEGKWMRDHAGSSLCSRVLFLMHPDRFGFEKYGWIH